MAGCTAPETPCRLQGALSAAQAGDTLGLADGNYNVKGLALPSLPLHWQPTDPQTRPVLNSSGAAPTIDLVAAQSGTSSDHLEIENTNTTSQTNQPALRFEPGAAGEGRSSLLVVRSCVYAPDAGPVTIGAPDHGHSGFGCLSLGAQSAVRRSAVGAPPGYSRAARPSSSGRKGFWRTTA